jgi:hypothetical protein
MTNRQAPTKYRFTATLRQPSAAEVELVISTNGETAVYALTLDQLKLFAVQAVRVLATWPEGQS